MAPTLRSQSQPQRASVTAAGVSKSRTQSSPSPHPRALTRSVSAISLSLSTPGAASGGAADVARGGRRSTSSPASAANATTYSGPKFVAFPCRWAGCQAELHNLDTLKRHLFKVHDGRLQVPEEGFACQWIDCDGTSVSSQGDSSPPASRASSSSSGSTGFKTICEFQSHIQRVHLLPIAWKMGDGPRDNFAGNDSDPLSFLKDALGRQVTPSVDGQKVEKGNAYRLNSRRYAISFEAERRNDPAVASGS